jgi:hypothetical protein
MYLYKKTYVKQWSHQTPEETFEVTVTKGGEPFTKIKRNRICEITEEVAYWRTFNALHGWFVNHCGNGEDNCQEMHVDSSSLEELLTTLKQVQEILNNSKLVTKTVNDWKGGSVEVEVYECEEQVTELLEPTEGFFFGGTDIDEYYKEQVDETVEVLEELLSEDSSGEYYYRASW